MVQEPALAQDSGSQQKVLILFDGPTTGYSEGLISALVLQTC